MLLRLNGFYGFGRGTPSVSLKGSFEVLTISPGFLSFQRFRPKSRGIRKNFFPGFLHRQQDQLSETKYPSSSLIPGGIAVPACIVCLLPVLCTYLRLLSYVTLLKMIVVPQEVFPVRVSLCINLTAVKSACKHSCAFNRASLDTIQAG